MNAEPELFSGHRERAVIALDEAIAVVDTGGLTMYADMTRLRLAELIAEDERAEELRVRAMDWVIAHKVTNPARMANLAIVLDCEIASQ